MTTIIKDVQQWRDIATKITGKTLGLVPTMGGLHAGHISLIKKSQAENDITVLTIFLNPTQFNRQEDLETYPACLKEDVQIAQDLQVDYVFTPTTQTMYPDDFSYQVTETNISKILEGAHRPGHFTGMLTIVLKILILFQADKAYFGEKDFQQLQLIQGLVAAFFIKTTIIACPTLRDQNGLALSSRNKNLNNEQRAIANKFAKILREGTDCASIIRDLKNLGITVDYVKDWREHRLAAVCIEKIRLIDNVTTKLI